MKEIRIHARAGQGAITTAALLGEAYFKEGRYPYAFPHFGAARMGAPMNAFVRVDSKPVRTRSQIYEPDYVIVVDNTLMRAYNCLFGLKNSGIAIVNGAGGLELPKLRAGQKVFLVPANEIALETIGRPLGNTALIGAFAAATGEIRLETFLEVLKRRFSDKVLEGNVKAAQKGFEFVKSKIQ
ncbi:MAG: 2-oxoacid:acceptor oxidoreductase family protein [Candidatus Omnitrophica bacterium]|nr:2-oxoacid:acceptor oxidoreductase family protein [Candidatus Omnitrophota bacterium]